MKEHPFGPSSRAYREAVEWIALNDDESTEDAETIAGYVTVAMLSDLSGVNAERIARRILAIRRETWL